MKNVKKGLIWFFDSFIWLGVLLLVIDVITKNMIVQHKAEILANDGIVLIPNFLRISYVINTHVAFGMGSDNLTLNRIVFIVVAILVSALIVGYFAKNWNKTRKLYRAVGFMVIAGALGNAIDRIAYTPEYLGVANPGVVDWIDFYGIWKWNFNIADSCVVVAAIILIIVLIIEIVKEKKQEAKKPKEPVEKIMSKSELEKEKLREENKDTNE